MSILIKGIDEPTKCIRCPFAICGKCVANGKDVSKAVMDAKRDKDCPVSKADD